MVHKYRVSFFKRLADSTGHAVDACQATLEVSAHSEQQAIITARRRFAEDADVGTWSLRADYETAVLADTPPAGPGSRKLASGHAASRQGMHH